VNVYIYTYIYIHIYIYIYIYIYTHIYTIIYIYMYTDLSIHKDTCIFNMYISLIFFYIYLWNSNPLFRYVNRCPHLVSFFKRHTDVVIAYICICVIAYICWRYTFIYLCIHICIYWFCLTMDTCYSHSRNGDKSYAYICTCNIHIR